MILAIISCNRENVLPVTLESPQLPEEAYNYKAVMSDVTDFTLPEVLLGVNESPFGNEIFTNGAVNTTFTSVTSNAKATLGRVLFYDKNLSQNNTISCSNCHNQANGFSDDGARAIADALLVNTSLTTLDLGVCEEEQRWGGADLCCSTMT